MILSRPLVVTIAAGAIAGVGVRLVFRWWRNEVARTAQTRTTQASGGEEEEQDLCAICLERPQFECRTSCGHSFCTDCFVSWWRQQQGSNAELAGTRCPLCTQSVLSITPRFTAAELIDSISRASTVIVYNACAKLATARSLHRSWSYLLWGRKASMLSAQLLYAVNAFPWAMAELPPPRDTTLRLYVLCHLLQARWQIPGAVLQPEEVRDRMHDFMCHVLLHAMATKRIPECS